MSMDIQAQIRELESRLLSQEIRSDPASVAALLADGVVLATYLCSSSCADDTAHSLRSSIWRRHLDSWQMVFHQGTRMSDAGF